MAYQHPYHHSMDPNAQDYHGSQGAPASSSTQQAVAFTRPFALYEALPYTPFTSIVPFDPSILPTPSIGAASPAPSLIDLLNTQDFDGLNQELHNTGPSKRVQHTLSQVQHLIERANITEFKFKIGPKAPTSGSSSTAAPIPSLASTLSPFSKMVYEQTSIPFRYPTPDTPGMTSTTNGQQQKIERTTPVLVKQESPVPSPKVEHRAERHTPTNTPKNRQAYSQNRARFEIVLPTRAELERAQAALQATSSQGIASSEPPVSTRPSISQPPPQFAPIQPAPLQPAPQQPTLSAPPELAAPVPPKRPSEEVAAPAAPTAIVSPTKSTSHPPSNSQRPAVAIAIELPHAPAFNKSEYMAVPDEPDEPVNLSERKRKREDLDEELYGESLGFQQRSNAALHELRIFLQQVFEAENYAVHNRTSNEWVLLTIDGESTLSPVCQTKAQTLLAKVISLNCFHKVPLQDLLRLLRLCENALKQADSLEIKVEESWAPADVDSWIQQLPALETALKAARTALRMMCGGREDKQLYSEDTIDQSLNLFKRVMDGIVIPVAELRSSDNTAELFKLLSSHKKRIASLFNDSQKLFSQMSVLLAKIDTSDTVTNTLEFTASQLIFLETAHAERESVLDTQKFDGFRLVAMDMLSQIFHLNPAQRQGIFDEILTSLEKLPLGKRARTFKLVDGSSIQPVSALIMRLVQTSAGQVDETKTHGGKALRSDGDDEEDELAGAVTSGKQLSFVIRDEDHGAIQHSTAIQELTALATPLMDTAKRNASYVVNFIVNRALTSTKSGDTPYRNLLDLFVEDFTTCLDNPDWPAAELLLRLLNFMMVKLVEGDKTSVTAKNMALELMGTMGAAISKLRSHVRKTANALDARDADELGLFLSDLAASALELRSRPETMVAWVGPYRATLEWLESRFTEDPHLASAISFIISDWGTKVCVGYDSCEDDDRERDQEFGKLAYRLRQMIQDRRWLSNEYSFKKVSPNQAKLSYSVTLLRSQLCESFGAILNILLGSMASDQPTVRSKSLKSINQVLETDPSILDGDSVVVQLILRCSNDSSTQVRDSALGLIGKCISMRPELETKMIGTVVDRFIDAGPGVRKRAMKLAKDIYLRNKSKAIRSAIANGLLHRVQDPEESVRDLARQVIEEIWFIPFQEGENSASSQISFSDHVALMVQTVKQGNVTNVLDKVLQTLLAPDSKCAAASLEVCRKLVASMFELVDNPESGDSSVPSGRDALTVLQIFAKADPSLFTFEQLRLLKPHIDSMNSSEDLVVSRAVVVIYKLVLPQVSSVHNEFLTDARNKLLPAVPKVTRVLLDDIVACLWIISERLNNSDNLARLVCSSLVAINQMRVQNPNKPLDGKPRLQFERYSLIVGMIGKHCNLDSHLELFKQKLGLKMTGSSISKLMVDIVVPFASHIQPLDVRKAALDSVGLVCQSSPRNYVAANVYTTFQQVFDDQNPALESMVLRSFREFLFTEEKRSEQAPETAAGDGKGKKKRELTVIGGTNYDDVASATTHRFLKEIIRIATATQDEHAFLAVEVLASINRQGLVHPKETGVTFITLETSSNPRISELAFLEHKSLHGKHETVVEREYVKAIQSAFAYQRDIVKDPRGATVNPFTPKLHLMMEVLKISKSKNRQKFLEKLCTQVDFDVSKLELTGEELPPHVQYARFIIENMAFFEYMTVGELQSTVYTMEKLVTSTGSTIAQVIESEVFQVRMDAIDGPAPEPEPTPAPAPTFGEQPNEQPMTSVQPVQPTLPDIDIQRLRQLTAGSMILLALWEVRTYLRRLYNMGTNRREQKAKIQGKDLSRPPVKVQGVTGDKVWEEIGTVMTGLISRERMMQTCKAFVELMNVDKEFLVQDEDEDEDMMDPSTPPSGGEEDDYDEAGPAAGPGRGRKRKSSATGPNGSPAPKRRGRPPRSNSKGPQGPQGPPKKRGRPRKNPLPEASQQHDEMEADWL
ncbi:hypothetical protein GE21DRAFT_6680 [Neurospora crassa]|uniref:Sister chromatid cohesion protein n=1 Tax=Neurospora crassa (strain ATCC 24698 / 74-OR23-1A / CBS 708.71 / DSM 1257 / FGSC 987) TaxID=367110 RepID=Q7S893_NEUCR|nr:hypothetical protein NCU05250 [Neurospora crassa OR74A]EAA32551.1 hypothetical protein NCU05250 [Neurospora crassa OR74A]KHE85360.1 hypothetical protein GE21DRAFT_6680 [Neurospora crassa]|eukprot:XP_961787.1 hypothetical protein NCU05250 [Neurospora crassa OR74A]